MAEEDWRRDLNPGVAAMRGSFGDHVAWAEKNLGLPFLFSEIWYPRLGSGGRKDCAFVSILKDFGISMKTLLLSSL